MDKKSSRLIAKTRSFFISKRNKKSSRLIAKTRSFFISKRNKKQTEGIEWLLKKVKKKYPDAKIILFGSRVRGDFLKSSDYDILILSEAFENMQFRKRLFDVYELVDRPVDVEIICLTHSEFRERKNELSIIGTIAKEGVVI